MRLQVCPVLHSVGGLSPPTQEILTLKEPIEIGVVHGPAGFIGDERILRPGGSQVEGFGVVVGTCWRKGSAFASIEIMSRPMWETSKIPALLRVVRCSFHDSGRILPPAYPNRQFDNLCSEGLVRVIKERFFRADPSVHPLSVTGPCRNARA